MREVPMLQKVNLEGKKLPPARKGKPSDYKMLKIRTTTYMKLLEKREDLKLSCRRKGRRASFDAVINHLLREAAEE
ncbi:MAG: hypothetical protein ABC585_05675 [Candidatus Methanosuratincola petrocarbonis]